MLYLSNAPLKHLDEVFMRPFYAHQQHVVKGHFHVFVTHFGL